MMHRHFFQTYVLRVHVEPKKRSSTSDYDLKTKTLAVTGVDNLTQLMDEIERQLGLRSTSRKLLQSDLVRNVWKPVLILADLKPSPDSARVAFEEAIHRSVPRVMSTPALTRAQKKSTLRRYYHSIGEWRNEAEIDKTLCVYSSDPQWESLMTKLQNKYQKPVTPWTEDVAWRVPERRGQMAAVTPRHPVQRESTEFVCS